MNLPSLHYLLLKLYFPAAFLIAIILAILDVTMLPALGQRIVTVTVYVTVVQTVAVPVYVPVTMYVPVTSILTSLMTLTTTAVSVSLGTVTLWNTVTSVRTSMGVLGSVPGTLFGAYGDAGIMGLGAVMGAALTLLFARYNGRPRKGGLSSLEGRVIDVLNEQDQRSQDLLNQVVNAANATSSGDGNVEWGGQEADLQGTGGVALLESEKDAIQTAASNISGTTDAKKKAEEKMKRDMA